MRLPRRRRRTARSSGSTGRSWSWTGPRARRAGRATPLPGPADPRRPHLPRDALRSAAADAGHGARDRARGRPRGRHAAAGARQLGPALRRRRPPRRRPHDGLRRDRPPPLRAGAASRARAASTRSRCVLQRSLLAGELPADGRFEVGVDLPARRPRRRGRRRLVRRVLARRRGRARRGRRRRRRARDRRRRDDGPAAQRGPRARLDGPGPGARRWTRSTRTRAATPSGDMATVVLRAGRPRRRATMRYACAGHLPPVLLEPGRGAAVRCGTVARSRSTRTPAGRRAPRRRASSSRARRCVLYTDGLVERRDRSLDEGMHALVGAGRRSSATWSRRS